MISCGKDKPPTGGPKDTTPPEIIDVEPGNGTKNFSDDKVIFTFTETIDERSFEDALTIYPPIIKKKISSGKQSVTVQFKEDLKQGQTYLMTIDTRCTDLRDNALEKAHSFVFSTSDSLISNRLDVNLQLEDRAPRRKGIYYVELYNTEDTLLITSQNSEEIKPFFFENLPSNNISIRAFLDENRNLGIDRSKELFQEKTVTLNDDQTKVKLTLTLQDTISPTVKSITPQSAQSLTVNVSEDIKDFSSLTIDEKESGGSIQIYEYVIDGSKIECITAVTDTNSYLLTIQDLTDYKNNTTLIDSMSFINTQPPDTTWLELDSLSHEDGQTVTTLTPEFIIKFNKIIPQDALSVMLVNSENNESFELDITQKRGYTFVVKPKGMLNNYVPYSLIINEDTSDYEGNTLEQGLKISILPLLYN